MNSSNTNLQVGSIGKRVEELQKLLRQYGYDVTVNGVFGAETERAVKDFQFTYFLKSDAVVGPKTWQVLYEGAPVDMPTLKRGDRQEEVRIVQVILANLIRRSGDAFVPYFVGQVDEFFGAELEQAVMMFQANSGLKPDGVVGQKTWYGLSRHGHLLHYAEDIPAVSIV